MTKKLLGKCELIFLVTVLSIINIMCISKFLYTLIEAGNFISFIKLIYEEKISMASFNIILIFSLVLSMISFIISFVIMFVKNDTAKKDMFIINIIIFAVIALMLFVLRFICGNRLSIKYYNDELENFYPNYEYIINSLYLVGSLVISLFTASYSYKLSNFIYNKNGKTAEQTKVKEPVSEAEQILQDEIKNLKEEIKLNNLKEEIAKLRNTLNEKKE